MGNIKKCPITRLIIQPKDIINANPFIDIATTYLNEINAKYRIQDNPTQIRLNNFIKECADNDAVSVQIRSDRINRTLPKIKEQIKEYESRKCLIPDIIFNTLKEHLIGINQYKAYAPPKIIGAATMYYL